MIENKDEIAQDSKVVVVVVIFLLIFLKMLSIRLACKTKSNVIRFMVRITQLKLPLQKCAPKYKYYQRKCVSHDNFFNFLLADIDSIIKESNLNNKKKYF